MDRPSLDTVFAALADPTRRAILAMLLEDDMAVTDVAEPFEMSLAAISKHLAVLTEAGLISQEKRGRVKWCKLEPDALRDGLGLDAGLRPVRAGQPRRLRAVPRGRACRTCARPLTRRPAAAGQRLRRGSIFAKKKPGEGEDGRCFFLVTNTPAGGSAPGRARAAGGGSLLLQQDQQRQRGQRHAHRAPARAACPGRARSASRITQDGIR